jgi:tetratricopeptide (TPR) repeat protein
LAICISCPNDLRFTIYNLQKNMSPSYRQIAELFGLTPPEADDQPILSAKLKGNTAEESSALGGQSLSEGHFDKAIEHFKRAIEQGGEDPGRFLDLGGAYEAADMAPQALRQFLKALRNKQDALEPHLGIAELYKREGRWRDSIAEIEEALNREPDNPYYQHKLAEMYRESRYRDRALEAIQRAVASAPADSFYHYWMGDLLIEMGRYGEALEAFRAAVELSPGDDYLYVRSAVAFWLAGKRPEAIKAIRLASDLDPENHLHHGLLWSLLKQNGQVEEAEAEFKRASKMDDYDKDKMGRLLREMKVASN